MNDLVNLLSLYNKNPKKFDKEVKKATQGEVSANDVVSTAINLIKEYTESIESGALRPVRTDKDLYSVIKLGKYLVGREVYRIWSGGKGGKSCSKVLVKSIKISEAEIYIEVKAISSSSSMSRYINLSDLGVTWFLSEKDCKEAISRM